MQLAKQRGVDLCPAVIVRIKQMWTALNPDDVPDPEDNKVKKPDFRDEFMKQGPSQITKREYETVWKFARVLAGLPERARAGLKPRKKT